MASVGQTGYPQEKDVIPDVTGKPLGGNTDPNADHSNVTDRTSQATMALEDKSGYDLDGLPQTPTSGTFLGGTTTPGGSAWITGPTVGTTVTSNSGYSRLPVVGSGPTSASEFHDHGMPGVVREVTFSFDTVTSPIVGTYRYRVRMAATLLTIRCALGTVGTTGLPILIDIRKNGVSMIASGKPQINVGQTISTNVTTYSTLNLSTDDLISINIDQGSSGAQLDVFVELQDNPASAPPVGVNTIILSNPATTAALQITQTGATSSSTSVGGAINLDNTNNTGAGLVIYSNQGAPAGRLLNVRADNALFNQDVVHIDNDGTGSALGILTIGQGIVISATAGTVTNKWAATFNQTGATGTSSGALNLTSDNPNSSTLNVAGQEIGLGTIKVGHTGTGTDSSSSGLSIDLLGESTACLGIFLKSSTTSGTTGDLLTLRNPNLDMLIVHSNGRVKFANSVNHATTATAGAIASPGNFLGFLICENNAGTVIKIPYFSN